MGAMSVGHRVIADAGDIRRELVKRRRERALFQLSLEGANGVILTSKPDDFVIAATYDDDGYANEPLRAKIIAMDNTGVHKQVPFDGGNPDDLIDAMIKAYEDWLKPVESGNSFWP